MKMECVSEKMVNGVATLEKHLLIRQGTMYKGMFIKSIVFAAVKP